MLRRALCSILGRHSPRRRRRLDLGEAASHAGLQSLEKRLVLATSPTLSPVVMLAATAIDSRAVKLDYRIDPSPDPSPPLAFGVYRSSDPAFGPNDILVEEWSPSSGLDDAGQPANSPGTHELTVPIPGGLSIAPRNPYVLVVANPDEPSARTDPGRTASFRKYTIGVVTHGALVNTSWKRGPVWQHQTARILRRQGYDAVVPFAWVSQSQSPGGAPGEGPVLARKILSVAGRFPGSSPIDLHLIGHSEGAVVNTLALVKLQKSMTPQIRAGTIVDTLLDPHAANNAAPGQASTASNLIGAVARGLISDYQSKARDPLVYIPASVSQAEVYYQHLSSSRDHGVNGGNYNLWGQVPVANLSPDPVRYFNLTRAGATHSGKYGVQAWYNAFVAPTLGSPDPWIRSVRVDGQVAGSGPYAPPTASSTRQARHLSLTGPMRVAPARRPQFSGTATPGSVVRLFVGPASNPSTIDTGGQTVADPSGHWTITTRALRSGRFRAIVMAFPRRLATRPGMTVVAMTPLGQFRVAAPAGSGAK